jgi:hypothetical protein
MRWQLSTYPTSSSLLVSQVLTPTSSLGLGALNWLPSLLFSPSVALPQLGFSPILKAEDAFGRRNLILHFPA